MRKFIQVLTISATAVAVICMLVLILAYPTMLLWNGLMPEIFGLPPISFFQALGLLALSTLLFRDGSSTSKSKN